MKDAPASEREPESAPRPALALWVARVGTVAGALVLALGALGLIGWHLELERVLQVRPEYTPMVYSSALCFVLAGLALLVPARRRAAVLGLGLFVTALAASHGLQYLLPFDLGVDRLWMEPYITVGTPHPGRMAPNTALCLVLAGASLALLAVGRRACTPLAGLSGMIVLDLAANSFAGYFTGIRSAYGWGAVPMAIHSAVGLGVLGVGLVARAWGATLRTRGRTPRWLPLAAGLPAATATISLWHAARIHDSALPLALLVTGLASAMLLSLAVWLAQRASLRERETREVCRALESEVYDRELAEIALARSEGRLARVVETIAEGLFLVNQEGCIIYANARAEELVGLSREVIQQRHHDSPEWRAMRLDGTLIPAEDMPAAHVLRTGEPVFDVLIALEREAGRRIVIRVNAAPLHDPDGTLTGVVASVSDVTRQSELDQLKDSFVSTVSHELRTPLASLRGFAELMLQREFTPEKRREFLGIIHGESIRLGALVDDFLDIQRLESGRAVYDFRRVELAPLMEATRALFAAGAHVLRLAVPPELAVRADPDRLRQVLSNLVSNAQKFSPAGSEIALTARRAGELVRVSVADQGAGIEPDVLPKLFQKFFRADSPETRRVGGTGLGLSLVKEIVVAHGGSVWAESERGRGSTFHFTLPVVAEPAPALTPAFGLSCAAATTDVLLVEDDESFARLLRERLSGEGLCVQVCPSGEGALEHLRRFPARLVLLDLRLAGPLDGWDVLVALKSDSALREVPVLLLSGSEAIEQRGLALAGADYLMKPVAPDWLRQSILRRLGGSGARRLLVVDDDPAFGRHVTELLEGSRGIEVALATNGTEALERIGERMPDLLVLDLLMPDIDGFELLRRLRRDKRAVGLPVLVVTAKLLSTPDKAYLTRRMATLVRKQEASLDRILETVRQLLGSGADQDLQTA